MKKLIEEGFLTQSRSDLIRAIQTSKMDFRELIKFKTCLFDTKAVTLDNKISEQVFLRCKRESPFTNIRNDFDGLEQRIL